MNVRYLIAGAILATISSAASACPDCDADYMAFMAQQAAASGDQDSGSGSDQQAVSEEQAAQDEKAKQQAFQEYEAKKMAEAKAAFLDRFKFKADDGTTIKSQGTLIAAKTESK